MNNKEVIGMDVAWEQKTNTAYISLILTYQVFVELLTANGFNYSESDWWNQAQNELSVASKTLAIGNESIGVFEYGSKAVMEKDAAQARYSSHPNQPTEFDLVFKTKQKTATPAPKDRAA